MICNLDELRSFVLVIGYEDHNGANQRVIEVWFILLWRSETEWHFAIILAVDIRKQWLRMDH
jgi:hypothetical protein